MNNIAHLLIAAFAAGTARGQLCQPLDCVDDACTSNASVACTLPLAVNECPCECNAQCPDLVAAGIFCEIRDCWVRTSRYNNTKKKSSPFCYLTFVEKKK